MMSGDGSEDNASSLDQFWNDKEEYPDAFLEHLLQQHQAYVEHATRTSERRVKINRFYVAVLSALVASISFIPKTTASTSIGRTLILSVLLFGILLCGIWFVNIHSYSQLNKQKYQVIHEVEQKLPYSYYEAEWDSDELQEGDNWTQYIPHARVEQAIPVALAIPYLFLLARFSLEYVPYMAVERGVTLILSMGIVILLVIIFWMRSS